MQVQGCEFPDNFYYDVENDVWLRPISESQVILGATSILSFVAGKIKTVNLKGEISFVNAGQSIATLESAKYFGAIRSPIDAEIVELNLSLEGKPSMINESPYGNGWIAKLRVAQSMQSTLSGKDLMRLVKNNKAVSRLEERIRELRVHCFKKLPDDELSAVGLECAATLVNLNELLKTRPVGVVVHVISDDPLADLEMIRWADQTKNELIETRIEDNLYHFIVEKKHD